MAKCFIRLVGELDEIALEIRLFEIYTYISRRERSTDLLALHFDWYFSLEDISTLVKRKIRQTLRTSFWKCQFFQD